MEATRKYKFHWGLLGDLAAGRPHLGPTTRVEAYRLMEYSFRDVLEERLGPDMADAIFYEAGRLAGREFYQHMLGKPRDFGEFVQQLQSVLRELGIGILRIEGADAQHNAFTLTMAEDLDCSGLPELDHEVCKYDEGFLASLLEGFFGKPFQVREVDCWCTGDRTCRFAAQAAE